MSKSTFGGGVKKIKAASCMLDIVSLEPLVPCEWHSLGR